MKIARIAVPVVLGALAIVQANYVWTLRNEVHQLSRRVQALSSELVERREPSPIVQTAISALGAGLLQAPRGEPDQTSVSVESVRGLVSDEMKRRTEEDRAAAEAHLEEFTANVRQSVGRELDINEVELARLEDLGNALRDAESALDRRDPAGRGAAQSAQQEQAKLWVQFESDVQRLVGDGRFARFAALRREHPEFARVLYVLRPPPDRVSPAVAELSVPTDQTHLPRSGSEAKP